MKKNLLNNYISGHRRGESARNIERMAQDDPFLADAIDGFDSVEGDHSANIAKMQKVVESRTMPSHKYTLTGSMYWKSIAVCAVLALLVGGGYLLMLDEKNSDKQYSVASSDSESIELYVPQKYIEKKDNLIMEGRGIATHPIADIENIEVLSIEKDLYLYIPKDYSQKERKNISSRPELKISNLGEIDKN